ncbi:MAG: hypothetical protein JSR44_15410 [Spirochaetes bacterium]|nr:hypothetical protein [Spirochaetota bacterium]
MNMFRGVAWFPKLEKQVYEQMFDWRMLVSYFGATAFFIGIFCIPFVHEITGVEPWEITLVGAMHFTGGMLPQMLFRKMNLEKFMIWETFSDRLVMSSLALFGSPDASFLWLFLVFICVVDAVAVAPNVYSALTIFIAPLIAWSIFLNLGWRDFSAHDLAVILTVSLITLMVWLFIGSATKQYRRAQSKVENVKAETELERRRNELARDIHDAVAAIFTRILATQKDEQSETAELTRMGLAQLRDIVTALQAENTSLGFLASWINHFGQQYFDNSTIRTSCTVSCDAPETTLDPVRIIHAMRIYQELCQNTLKHSGATTAITEFVQKGDEISLVFSDNGRGYEAQTPRGDGLDNIDERVRALAARIDHVKNPQGGMTTKLVFLLNTPTSGD